MEWIYIFFFSLCLSLNLVLCPIHEHNLTKNQRTKRRKNLLRRNTKMLTRSVKDKETDKPGTFSPKRKYRKYCAFESKQTNRYFRAKRKKHEHEKEYMSLCTNVSLAYDSNAIYTGDTTTRDRTWERKSAWKTSREGKRLCRNMFFSAFKWLTQQSHFGSATFRFSHFLHIITICKCLPNTNKTSTVSTWLCFLLFFFAASHSHVNAK